MSACCDDAAALFLVPVETAGVERADHDAIDGRILSDFMLDGVVVDKACRLSGGSVEPTAAIAQAVDLLVIAQCSEALGGIDRAIELTADYLKVRQQFGQPLAISRRSSTASPICSSKPTTCARSSIAR